MTLLGAPAQRDLGAAAPRPVPGPAVVTVRDLSVAYGEDTVLTGVDLDLFGGEVVALLGASGSGKSSLMKSLTGFAPITGGSAVVDGHELRGARPRELRTVRAGVGQIFQQFNLIPRLSVLTNVLAGCLHRTGPASALGHFPAHERRRALELLDRVGIAHKANEPARSLSGGQQQRVAIARALMQQPRVILADEPVASLDPRLADSVLALLRDIAVSDGIPVLVSLHVVDLALVHSDRIVGLRDGRALLSGRAGELGSATLHELYADEEDPDVDDL